MPYPPVSVPVALLVGSGCVSSRDEVAQGFSDYRFGPLVGEPTAAGYRVFREQIELSLGPHRKLGFLSLALSYEVSGKTGLPFEAVPLTLTRRVPLVRWPLQSSSFSRVIESCPLCGSRTHVTVWPAAMVFDS